MRESEFVAEVVVKIKHIHRDCLHSTSHAKKKQRQLTRGHFVENESSWSKAGGREAVQAVAALPFSPKPRKRAVVVLYCAWERGINNSDL
jgi:hypothetical protein